jgi:hypothetical protein
MASLDLGGGYSIDLDDAQKFVKALEDTMKGLNHTLTVTGRGLQVAAPGHDDYSGVFANTMNGVIQQHYDWNRKKQRELQDLIDKVDAAIKTYHQTEQHNTPKV